MVHRIPPKVLERLPWYHRFALRMADAGRTYVTSREMAQILGVDESQVRKDLAVVGLQGRPRAGFGARELAESIAEFLGLSETNPAVLVGVGHLGTAIARYPGFVRYGVQVIGLFDHDPEKIGTEVGELLVMSMADLPQFVYRNFVKLGILTVSRNAAQGVANLLVNAGILAVWNFSGLHLHVSEGVLVKDEDLAISLAALSHHLKFQAARVRGSGS